MSSLPPPHGLAAVPAAAAEPPSEVKPLRHRGGGFIVWFTGLSGAGKSTLSRALETILRAERPVEVLDGDEVRTYLSKGLGFSREDRDSNIRRIGYVARLLARNGAAAIAAAISPYAATREEVRDLAERDGVPFIEVFASASVEKLAERDVKGLYRKALAGQIEHFTGVSDPYEAPTSPDVLVRTDSETAEESLSRILAFLEARGLAAPRRARARRGAGATSGPLLPLFLKLEGRPALVVGGGAMAAARVAQLLEAGARVTVVAPEVRQEILASGATVRRRRFRPADLDGAWLAVAAATPEVDCQVARAAEKRRVFVNAVDRPRSASAYTGAVLRRGGVAVAVSTGGRAPALAGLLRQALEAILPEGLDAWLELAQRLRAEDRAAGVPQRDRRRRLLEALLALERAPEPARREGSAA